MSLLNSIMARLRRSAGLTALLALVAVLSGCHAARESRVGDEASLGETKITADAYSFNARIWRDGKPTTFKLELYYTDSLIGVAARGYLGKGAFKGWLDADSVKIYFPHTNELLYEALDGLVSVSDCGVSVAGLGFLELFVRTPDSMALPSGVAIHADYASTGRPEFRLESENADCPWVLDLGYDRQDDRLTPSRIEFDNGRGIVLKAERERFRARIGIPLKRFRVEAPADAMRTIP